MENSKEKIIKAEVWRRATQARRGKKADPPAESHRGLGGMVAAALILALAAFISGAWMGKALTDLSYREKASSARSKLSQEVASEPAPSVGEDSAKPQAALPFKTNISEEKITEPEPPKRSGAPEQTKSPEQPNPDPKQRKEMSPSKPKFTLQIAALHNLEEARDLVNKLRAKGYPAYQITGSAAAKGNLYRVRVGQFQSLQEARQSALDFEKKEKTKTIITSVQ